jgi:hypothetical protein
MLAMPTFDRTVGAASSLGEETSVLKCRAELLLLLISSTGVL